MRLKLIVLTSFLLSNTVVFHANAETKQASDRLDRITISPAFNKNDPRLKDLKFLNFTSPLMADVDNQVICINYARTENNLGMNDELSNVYSKFNQIYKQNKDRGMIYYCDGGEKAVASSSSSSIPLSVVEEQYKIGSGLSTTYNNNYDQESTRTRKNITTSSDSNTTTFIPRLPPCKSTFDTSMCSMPPLNDGSGSLFSDSGNCQYSWQTDSLGRQCGGRSASQRSGGK